MILIASACAAAALFLLVDKAQRMRGAYGSWTLWFLAFCCLLVLWSDVRTFGIVSAQALATGGALGIGSGVAALLVLMASRALGLPDSPLVTGLRDATARYPVQTAMRFIACVPIIEESIYRGVLLRWLWPHGIALALLVTLALFVALHFDARSITHLVLVGVAFTIAAIVGGVVAAVVAHALSNAVGFAYGRWHRPPAGWARTRRAEGVHR